MVSPDRKMEQTDKTDGEKQEGQEERIDSKRGWAKTKNEMEISLKKILENQ